MTLRFEANLACILCSSNELQLLTRPGDVREYLLCSACDLLFLRPELRLGKEEEKKRYEQHNNQIDDPRYQKFVMPIVEVVKSRIPAPAVGLDFGSGTGPVLAYLLRQNDYNMFEYDSFFSPDISALKRQYDFIVSCEVVEHLFNPYLEFERLASLLNSGGVLVVQTLLRQKEDDIFNWFYSKDPTHVCFFSEKTLCWIESKLNFRSLEILSSRLIVLKK